MLKMFGRLKSRIAMVLAIFVLLFIQANTDLALPEYTSRIIDVGIQQKGVEDGVPDTMRETTYQQLYLLTPEADREFLENSYRMDGEVRILKEISEEEREKLGTVLAVPEVVLLQLQGQQVDVTQLPPEQIPAMLAAAEEKMTAVSETMLSQAAVSFTIQEYQQVGKDLDKIQMEYVLLAGLKMLGMALLGVICAIVVTFLSCRVAASLGCELRNDVYRKVISFPMAKWTVFPRLL